MENRKSLKSLILFLIIIFGIGSFRYVFTYKTTTHANLTSVMFDYYNQNFPEQKIPDEFKAVLVEGAVREDDPPRWLNHFYDPINNKGLSWKNLSWESSKSWAQNDKTQLALVYKANLASIVGLGSEPLIYTWQKAIKLYNEGNQKDAFLVLGHILHLLEDASVPDHTRNDAHADESPYEEFTKSLTPKTPEKKPIILNSLEEYFDAMANYSNNSFYSRDTIGEEFYRDPKPDYIARDGEYFYGFKIDDGKNYHLVNVQSKNYFSWSESDIMTISDDKNKILTDYWSHLSPKAIQYGAGVIDLFFQEASSAKASAAKGGSNVPVAKASNDGYLASALDAFKSLITNSTTDVFEEVAVVNLETKKVENIRTSDVQNTNDDSNIRTSDVQDIGGNLGTSDVEKIPEAKICLWENTQSPSHAPLIINEVNWQGSEMSTSDEWIELKNLLTSDVNILGWQLMSQSGNLKLKLAGKVSAGNFTVLKRGIDYKGALKNSADGLRLFDSECNLLDEVLAAPNWPAGNNAEKRSAERAADFSWHNGNLSSPGAENSAPPAFIASSSGGSVFSSGGGSSSVSPAPSVQSPVASSTVTESTSSTPSPTSAISSILISEFLFDAEGSDSEKEFIELYNPNSVSVDISSWSIQHKSASSSSTSKKNFENGSVIAPKSFYLIWLGSDSRGDLKWLSGSLNNTAAVISLVNGVEVVDSVSYNKETIFAPAGQSLERKALENGQCVSAQQSGEFLGNGCADPSAGSGQVWEVRATPNPQNKTSMPEPRDAPLAVQNFRADFSSATMELILNWDPSAGSGQVPSSPSSTPLTYQVVSDNDLRFVTSTAATSTKTFINEVGKEYKFSIQTFDKEGLISQIAETSITPKFLNSLYFYKDASSSQNFIEIKTDSYPFIPDLFVLGNRWKELVFYLNDNLENPLTLQYENCYNQTGDHGSLILPDDQMRCTNDGGIYSEGFNYKYIEDNNFVIKLSNSSSTFSPSDYITVVYKATHSASSYDGRIVYLQPVATDQQKYYFQEIPPIHQPPQFNGEITIIFRPEDSMAVINWPKATDPDTPNNLLVYEIKYDGGDWQEVRGNFDFRKVDVGETFSFSVRAKDPFGNYSESLFKNWEYSSPTSTEEVFML